MKIIVYGGTNDKSYSAHQVAECEKLGKYLGEIKAKVLTGACGGYPYYVGKSAIKYGAHSVVGYTPARDLAQHVNEYKFPTDGTTKLVYTREQYESKSEAFLRRSLDMTPFCDVVVALGGSWGTFVELLFSLMYKRTIILVEEFDGAVNAFENAYDFFGTRDTNPEVHNGANIIRVKTVDESIEKLVQLNR